MTMPLGFRAEFAGIRQAKLELVQSHAILKEQESKAQTFLAKQYSRLFEQIDVIETRRQQRQALADQIDVRFRKFAVGKIPVDFLQDSVRQWTVALSSEYRAIVEYNATLAGFHFAKGTLMDFDNVRILDGQMPIVSPIRAADFEKARTAQEVGRMTNPMPVAPMAAKSLPPAINEPTPLPILLTQHETPASAPPAIRIDAETPVVAPTLRLPTLGEER